MNKFKALVAAVLVCAMVVVLVGCGPDMSDLVGTWSGTYTYNGNSFYNAIVINSDGTYGKAVSKNGSFYSSEAGTVEIDGSEVKLHANSNMGSSTPYDYEGDALVNNGHYFYKK